MTDHVRPAIRFPADDARRHEIELHGGLLVAEQSAQTRVLRCILTRLEILDAQLVDLVSEHLILFMHGRDLPDITRHITELAADPGDGFLEGCGNRRDRLREYRSLKPPLRRKENDAENAHENKEERPSAAFLVPIPSQSRSHLTVSTSSRSSRHASEGRCSRATCPCPLRRRRARPPTQAPACPSPWRGAYQDS